MKVSGGSYVVTDGNYARITLEDGRTVNINRFGDVIVSSQYSSYQLTLPTVAEVALKCTAGTEPDSDGKVEITAYHRH